MNKEQIFSSIKQSIIDSVPEIKTEDIRHTTRLTDLGLDSIKIVELGVRLEDLFGENVVLDEWMDEQLVVDEAQRYYISELLNYIKGAIS